MAQDAARPNTKFSGTATAAVIINSGVISDFIGILPLMKDDGAILPDGTRERHGNSRQESRPQFKGTMTARNVCQRLAPSVVAASSTSLSKSCSAGCTVRTTNGSPMKVSATTTPSG
jgi:hypothetical protein